LLGNRVYKNLECCVSFGVVVSGACAGQVSDLHRCVSRERHELFEKNARVFRAWSFFVWLQKLRPLDLLRLLAKSSGLGIQQRSDNA